MPDPSGTSELLPLVLGISGHRDLRPTDYGRLKQQVEAILASLRAESPETPLWLLSPLAEGADQLAAEAALECGARLIVPLPMPLAMYERDFPPGALPRFRELLRAADAWFELPLAAGNESPEAIADYGEPRNRQYAQVGAYIALHSQLLIALWNGRSSGNEGGTWQVVEFMLDGVPEPYAPPTSALYDRESGPVYHLPVQRQSDESPPDANDTRLLQPGRAEERPQHERLQQRLRQAADRFNRDVRQVAPRLASQRANSSRYLLDVEQATLDSFRLGDLRHRFALVDALAIFYQQKTMRTLKMVLILSFAAVILLQSCLAKVAPAKYLLPLYAFVVAFSVGYYWWTKRARHESKYLDYRALAEGLRVQVFWRLAGLDDCVADYYLRRQRGVLEWVRNAIRNWTLLDRACAADSATAAFDIQRLRYVQRHWLLDQARYFGRAAIRNRRLGKRLKRLGQALVSIGFAIAVADALLERFEFLVVPAIGLPVAAGLIYLYVNKRGLNEHANQYERMAKLFSDASQRLDERIAANDVRGGQRLIFEIGQEALAENADWVILHRDRPLESPALV